MTIFDPEFWLATGAKPLPVMIWEIFKNGGWIIFDLAFLFMLKGLWKKYVQGIYGAKRKFIVLAIDVPKDNEKTPKTAENIFSQLAGAHGSTTKWEEWWDGEVQDTFGLEIVSLDGYVQFLIRTRDKFKDLMEASIYAQYPEAEITEVADYAEAVPHKYPNDTHDFFGLEYTLHKPECYPLKTHIDFIDKATGDFIDPMAALLEIMSKIGQGEQIWIQFVITPIDDKWKTGGEKVVQKLVGAKVEAKKNLLDHLIDVPLNILSGIGDILTPGEAVPSRPQRDEPSKILYLTPGESSAVEAIERKISKLGFKTKLRIMYIARKEVFDKRRGVNPVVGAFKQFNTIDLNRFAVVKKVWTKADYAFAKTRKRAKQNKLMQAYVNRSNWRGWGTGVVYNIEELASMYHFPVIAVRAPLVKKIGAKKGEPPVGLPIEDVELPREPRVTKYSKKYFEEKEMAGSGQSAKEAGPGHTPGAEIEPPVNLPIE